MREHPYTYRKYKLKHYVFPLQGLTIQDLEDLLEDIKVYVDMDAGKNADYWRDITVVTEDELEKLKKIDPNTRGMGEKCFL